jgi:excisionase family DNA binding protein
MAIGDPQASARERVWAALVAHPGSTAGHLASVAVVGKSTAAKALAAMERAGAAVREKCRPVDPPNIGTSPATWRATGQPVTPTCADLLTVAEVATRWRVSKMTILRLVHSEQLDALRVGHRFRIPRAAVEAFTHSAGNRAAASTRPRYRRPDPILKHRATTQRQPL